MKDTQNMTKGLFPGRRETLYSTVVISFAIGCLLGLLVNLSVASLKEVLGAVATLVAAFGGASLAFNLEKRDRRRKDYLKELDAANRLMFALYERMNLLGIYQNKFIEPHRESPGRIIEIRPLLDFSPPESKFNVEEVPFLLSGKDKDIVFDLKVIEEVFIEAIKFIRKRNELHLNKLQPLMEAASFKPGEEVTEEDIISVFGPYNFAILKQATDNAISMTDRFIKESEEVRTKLLEILGVRFNREDLFAFEIIETSD